MPWPPLALSAAAFIVLTVGIGIALSFMTLPLWYFAMAAV